MAISAYILKIVEKDPFLRLQIRAKEMFNRTKVMHFKTVELVTSLSVAMVTVLP